MKLRLTVVLLSFGVVLNAASGVSLAILCSENGSTCPGSVSQLQATGLFSSVTGFDTTFTTPTLAQISGYGAVLASTNNLYSPNNPTALGNLLASYYNPGVNHLTIAAYAYSSSSSIAGAVMAGNYAALTTSGSIADVSGNLVAVVPSDPIFQGISLSSVLYYHDAFYAHPALAPGATLLATDGAGVNMIARSANGVIDFNMYTGGRGQSAAFFMLVGQSLLTSSITSLSQNSGPVGASVTITGANFGATQGTSTVTFNGISALVTSWSATSITATVPSGATTGNVVVTVGGVQSNGVGFTVTPPASITSLSQNSGPVGASVTITGANFGATQGTSTVTFNGISALVTSWSATSITATVPSGATTGNVVVRVSGVQSNGLTFTLTAAVPALGPVAGLLLLAGMLVVAFYSLRRRQIA